MKTPFSWIACAIVLMLMAVLPAHAEVFGKTTVGSQPSGALSPNYKRVSKFVLSENAVLDGVYAYLDGGGGPQTGFQSVSAVIYADDNGVPGAKVFQSRPWDIPVNSPPHWTPFSSDLVPLPAGTYWLGIHSGGTVGIVRNYGDGSSATNWYGNADSYADEATGRFGPGSPGTGSLSIYALYFPAAQLSIAGRTTIAATPSGGMSTNFKRGSRFTMTERGRVTNYSAYVDSLGGGTSSQTVRLALYRDAAGVPGERLGMSEEITLAPGVQAQWRTVSASYGQQSPMLDPGNYWIVIHSSGTAGVMRNYGDGAANWYGNADTYSDGPSSPFGTGNAGTVTISAAVTYLPADVASVKFGRTSVATIPSGGMSANFIRGSQFSAYKLLNSGTVTALWAYLDGRGGASGSQQVRMALYEDDLYHGFPGYKQVESDVVTIAAGRPPGWVRFPVSTQVMIGQAPTYWIAIQTGNTAGVVRNYGDGPANWIGQPGTFSSGAPSSFPDRDAGATGGTVELSVYVEYAIHNN